MIGHPVPFTIMYQKNYKFQHNNETIDIKMKLLETIKNMEILILGHRTRELVKPADHWQQYRKPKKPADHWQQYRKPKQ